MITVPAAILSLLSISALFIAKKIDWNLRINVFVAEVVSSIGSTLIFIGYPLRRLFEVSDISQHQFPCSLSAGILATGEAAKLGSYTFYSIMVYVFMKKNVQSLHHGHTLIHNMVAITHFGKLIFFFYSY